jgi:hypothetical protein
MDHWLRKRNMSLHGDAVGATEVALLREFEK